MNLDPSDIIYFQWKFVTISATLVFTWITMIILTIVSFLITRNLKSGPEITKGQNALEAFIIVIKKQIQDVSRQDPGKYLPFIATLFIYIIVANILSVVPGYIAPTGSLNTTIALSICVFLAVPAFGIASQGVTGYLKQYIKPTVIMLPFNIISEFSRTLSLAIRLYGNVMSASIIITILIGVIPIFFPVVMQLLGLLTGVIQAYIFAILAIVYIGSATKKETKKVEEKN